MADRADLQHEACVRAFGAFGGNLVTSWPVISEAFYLLPHPGERDFLWEIMMNGGIEVVAPLFEDLARVRLLMEQYSDQPMDLADASLVALAERLRLRKVFTLDRRHFSACRPRHIRYFEIFP